MTGVQHKSGITIQELSRRVAALRDPKFRVRLSQVLGAAAIKLVNDGFRTSTDPYGEKWARLRHRKGQPLLDTGRLRASFTVRPTGAGFRIDASASYAVYHQHGTKPHKRGARVAAQNARGRFISRKKAGEATRKVRVAFIPEHTAGGIPARMMVPTPQRGLPPKWRATFDKDTSALIERVGRGGA